MSTIFVTKDKVYGNITSSNNVILSPHFYWLKKRGLKLFFEFQAKEYATSIFESSLPLGDFSYIVKKINNEFLFLAYDMMDVLEKLQALGIEKKSISRIYFAQFELTKNLPLKIGEKTLIDVDGIAQVVNQNLAMNDVDLVLESLKLSSTKLNVSSSSSFNFTPFLGVLLAVFLVEYMLVSRDGIRLEEKKEEIKKLYSLPQTSYQLKSILSKYEDIEKQQKFIRTSFKNLKYKQVCEWVEVNSNKLSAMCDNKKVELKR